MLLKKLKTDISGKQIYLQFPDSNIIILKGNKSSHILRVIESLLANDFTGHVISSDTPLGQSYIMFDNDSSVLGKDKYVQTNGKIPRVHCISNDGVNSIRSFCVSEDLRYCVLMNDMTNYSSILSDKKWVRLITFVNKYLGYEFVRLSDDEKLIFDFDSECRLPIKCRKFVYILFAECFLTQDNYLRVILLKDLIGFTNKDKILLLDMIKNIAGHGVAILTADIQISDVPETSSASFLSV